MPKVDQRKARTDIYNRGIRVPDAKTKSGFRTDKSQPADETDTLFCKKGDTYFAWGMMIGGRGVQRKSLTRPTRSQLTNSDFLGQIYDLEDNADFSGESPEDLQAVRDDLVSSLESLADEQDDKYSNMPDGLQQGDTGQLIEARAESCRNIASEFEGIDLDYEEPDEDELREELKEEDPDADDQTIDVRLEDRKAEKLAEWIDEKRGELQDVSWDYE